MVNKTPEQIKKEEAEAKAKVVAEEKAKKKAEAKAKKDKEEKKPKVDEVTVEFKGTSRVYSRELHGDDFMKIAKGFASKDKVQGKLVV